MEGKTVVMMMAVFSILIVCGIGYYIGITMIDEMENHPEITEIGAPPDLRIMGASILITALVCGIALKINPNKGKLDEEIKT